MPYDLRSVMCWSCVTQLTIMIYMHSVVISYTQDNLLSSTEFQETVKNLLKAVIKTEHRNVYFFFIILKRSKTFSHL